MSLTPPALLTVDHDTVMFDCGVDALNDWLRKRALANQAAGAARTYVVTDGARVVGYYALASGAISVADAPGHFRRNMPSPIPVVLLGRLAVDRNHKGAGLGRALVRDGAKRVLHAADTIGIRGIVVHALSDDVRAFYLALGFEPSPLDPLTLMVTLADLKAAL